MSTMKGFFIVWVNSFAFGGCDPCSYLRSSDAYHRHSLVATLLAAHDSNSRHGHVQTDGQETPQRVVGSVFHGRRCEAQLQRTPKLAFDRIATGARRNSNSKNN